MLYYKINDCLPHLASLKARAVTEKREREIDRQTDRN